MAGVTLPGDGTPVETIDGAAGAQRQVVHVANQPDTQPVSGSVSISNLPATQPVSGTVAVSNFPEAGVGLTDTQLRATPVPVSGTIAATGTFWQATQPVSGPLTDAQLRATPIPIASTAAQVIDAAAAGTSMYVSGLRQDADTSPVSASGDVHPFVFDEVGRLKVAAQPGQQPPTTGAITASAQSVAADVSRTSNITFYVTGTFAGHNVTFEGSIDGGTSWFAVQAVRTNANTIELVSGVLAAAPAYAWEASVNGLTNFRVRATAHTSGTANWRIQPAPYATEPIPAAQISGTQPVSGSVTVSGSLTSAGTTTNTPATPTASAINSAATTNATAVKVTAGTLYALGASNTGAAVAFVKLYNKASAPTVGTDVPVLVLPIPAGAVLEFDMGAMGYRFATGIALAITNLAADSDTTAVAAAQVKVLTSYI